MSAGTKRRGGDMVVFWALIALALCLSGILPARAQVRPATQPIVNSRLQRVVEMIPGSATDLPPYLVKPQDVYLLVTAGASYTDVQVLANPEVPPQTIANALSSALAGTSLRGRTVEWSTDRYSAAQVSVHQGRFGTLHTANTVPVAALASGLRRAGLIPHLLLRTARYAQTSLPSPHYGTKAFRWYDARHLVGQGSVTVTGTLSLMSLALVLAYFLLVPLFGLLGLRLAASISARGQQDAAGQRLLFRTLSKYAVIGPFIVQMAGFVLGLRSSIPAAFADLWFGNASTATLIPFIVVGGTVPIMLLALLAHRQEVRRFGAVAAGPAIPMSDEEKAVRKRVTQWSMLPHLIGALALGAVPLFVTRTNPLYQFIHPVAMFLPMLGAVLVGSIFQKRLNKFTQKTLDDDLTWRARQFGQTLGVRMSDVFVEDSSRAAHLAFASHQGHHVTLSRKLQETFTAAETDFVLAHHLACMKRRVGISTNSLMLGFVFPLPMFLLTTLIVLPRLMPGSPTFAATFSSSWFLPSMFIYLVLCGGFLMAAVMGATKRQAKQDIDADRDALEATGNMVAAESALDKLGVDALSPDAQMAMQLNSNLAGNSGRSVAQLAAARVVLRRAALQQTAQALGLAPSAKMTLPGLSPFSSSDADRR